MTLWILMALLIGPVALATTLTLFNLATWPRGSTQGAWTGTISVLIPARNEEETIEACVRGVLQGGHGVEEVIVCDDQSTDATPEILAALQEEFPQLRVIQGTGLPEGWIGKPHACHQLSKQARGDLLVFVDADTFLSQEGLARMASLLDELEADVVTAVPRQQTESFAERLILPLLHLTYTSWFPLMLTWRSRDARFLAANGQLLAVRRDAYDALGGFAAVRHEVVDDMAFCHRAKQQGHRVVFADGFSMASCRMYGSAREVWEGFSKNLYEGLGSNPLALLVVLVLYTLAFLVPYAVLAAGLIQGQTLWLALGGAGVILNVILRVALTWRFSHPLEGVLLHPLSVLGLLAIATNSFIWNVRGEIRWSGRVYRARSHRLEGETAHETEQETHSLRETAT